MNDVEQLMRLSEEMHKRSQDLMDQKNHDYRGGTGDPLANFRGATFLGIDPGVGILLRMMDKIMRLKTFAEKGELFVQGESAMDAALDIINYAVLFQFYADELGSGGLTSGEDSP